MDNKAAISYLLVVSMFCSVSALAQEASEETDPFHPGNRPSATSTAPADDVWGRDPFNNPLGGRTPAPKEPAHTGRGTALTGILYSKDVRLAIIGGETLREGSVVGDKKLVDIRRQSVVFVNASGGYEEVVLEDFSIRK